MTMISLRGMALRGFSYFGLVYYSQGVIAAVQAASGNVARTVAGETNLASTMAQSVILAGLVVAVLREPVRYGRLCRSVWPVVAVVAWALASVAWSGDPVRTLRRAVALGECLGFGLFLYRTAGLERTVDRVGRVCVAMAVLSLVVYVAAPGIGRETALGYERALRGVFPQKNSMSACMLLGLCCYAWRLGEGPVWRRWGAVGVLAGCLLLGRGASAVAVAGLVGAAAVWVRLAGRPVWRWGFGFLVVWAGVALAVGLIGFPAEVFALMGRDASLTGRVPLWEAILPEIARAPLVGHGYAGFWDASSPTVQMIWRYAGWEAPDAHSAYLDILLQLGVVGLALYGWVGVTLFARAAAAARLGIGIARFVWIYGLALLLVGTDEGAIGIPNLWMSLLPLSLVALSAGRLKSGLTLGGYAESRATGRDGWVVGRRSSGAEVG